MLHPDSDLRKLGAEDYLVLSAVVLLPWAFGGVDQGSFRVAAVLLVSAAAVAVSRRGLPGLGLGRDARWLIPALLLAAWAAVQVVPLPPAAVRLLSPAAYSLYAEAFPGYPHESGADALAELEQAALARVTEAGETPAPDDSGTRLVIVAPECLSERWRSLSVQPSATAELGLWYCALLLGFLVIRDRVRDPARFRVYRRVLFGLFAALAVFAFVQLQFWTGRILWFRRVLVQAHPFGPYFNPTNFAAVMELAVPALVGHAWSRLEMSGRAALRSASVGLTLLAAAVCFAAGLAAASKLAALLILVTMFALGMLGMRSGRGRIMLAGVALVAVLLGAFVLNDTRLGDRVGSFLKRSEQGHLLEGRWIVWQSSLDMLADYPITGAGFGTFGELFQRYQARGARAHWEHAHNDYLELALGGGAVALLLLVWLAWGYGRRLRRGVHRGAPDYPARLGLALGLLSLAIHAFVDFNHQIPADALIFVTVAALALAGGERAAEGTA